MGVPEVSTGHLSGDSAELVGWSMGRTTHPSPATGEPLFVGLGRFVDEDAPPGTPGLAVIFHASVHMAACMIESLISAAEESGVDVALTAARDRIRAAQKDAKPSGIHWDGRRPEERD